VVVLATDEAVTLDAGRLRLLPKAGAVVR
jgi:hypothetical protein